MTLSRDRVTVPVEPVSKVLVTDAEALEAKSKPAISNPAITDALKLVFINDPP
jgi:hypothetical protein